MFAPGTGPAWFALIVMFVRMLLLGRFLRSFVVDCSKDSFLCAIFSAWTVVILGLLSVVTELVGHLSINVVNPRRQFRYRPHHRDPVDISVESHTHVHP